MPHLHYMLDAYGVVEEHGKNTMEIYELLNSVANELELVPVMPPFLVPYYYCKDPEDGGISAFVICKGGHITIHTFPFRSCYFLDILSDNFFTADRANGVLQKYIYAENLNGMTIDRRAIYNKKENNVNETQDFGPHYMIEVNNFTATMEWIYTFLDGIAEQIDMLPITRPYVIFDDRINPEYISGILVVAQSHIAVHYDIKNKFMMIDIFSCAFLDDKKITALLKNYFGNNFRCSLFSRGSKYCDRYMRREERLADSRNWRNNCGG